MKKKICAFGDSVVKGVVLEDEKYKVSENSFSKICAAELDLSIKNKAKFGSTVANGIKSIERSIEDLENNDYEYVILGFGGNDCDFKWNEISEKPDIQHLPNNTIDDFKNMYTNVIGKVKSIGKKAVLMSLPPIDSIKYFKKISEGLNKENLLKWLNGNVQFIANWHERYNIESFKIAIANKIPIIDITSKFLERTDYSDCLCDDGIHPNESGHKMIADSIMEHIRTNRIAL